MSIRLLKLSNLQLYMEIQEQVIAQFYTSFQQRDAQAMNSCYDAQVVFFDPVFGLLEAAQVKKMWEMICRNGTDLQVTYGNIRKLDDEYYTCDWQAVYTYPGSGRKVVNQIRAHMRMHEGKIIEHSDAFSVHKWSRQALGFWGWLLGWNTFFQRRIKNSAHKKLLNYMSRN